MSIIDLNKYKEYKGINSDKNDSEIAAIIHSVNAFIPRYCGRSFVDYYADTTSKVEYHNGVDFKELYVAEFPIKTVVAVKSSTDFGETYDTTLSEFTDYVVDKENGIILSTTDNFVTSLVPTNSVEVEYRGGFDKYPEDIVIAAVSLTEYYIEEQYTPRKSLATATIENTLYTDASASLPPHIRRILEFYRARYV